MNRNRLYLLAAAGAVAVVVLVVVIVATSGGGSSSSATTTTTTSSGTGTGTTQEASIFAGIPQHGDTLGKPSAPATLLVFEDPQCPYCRDFNLTVLPRVISDFVAPGRLKLAYRGIQIIDDNSAKGIAAIYAAGAQNKLWQLDEEIYKRQGAERSGWITDSLIADAAQAVGADAAKIKAGMSSGAVKTAMSQSASEANQVGLQGTPSFYLQRPPGVPQQVQITSLDPAQFSAELQAALQ